MVTEFRTVVIYEGYDIERNRRGITSVKEKNSLPFESSRKPFQEVVLFIYSCVKTTLF